MSTAFGNTCLVLAALVSCIMFLPLFDAKPPRGNDEGATGYVIIIITFIQLIFLILLSMAAIAIARNGGFDWVSTQKYVQFILVSVGLLSAIITSAFSAMAKLNSGVRAASVTVVFQNCARYYSVYFNCFRLYPA